MIPRNQANEQLANDPLRDGKAPDAEATTMNDNTEADDEAQSYEAIYESIDEQLEELPTVEEAELGELCRTKSMKEITEELEKEVEELPELPTADEAELGELSQTPGFDETDLTKAPPTFEEIFGDDEAQTEEAVELAEEWFELGSTPSIEEDGEWKHIGTSDMVGWVWKTPVGTIPFGIADHPNEVLDFLEECTKTEGGDF